MDLFRVFEEKRRRKRGEKRKKEKRSLPFLDPGGKEECGDVLKRGKSVCEVGNVSDCFFFIPLFLKMA